MATEIERRLLDTLRELTEHSEQLVARSEALAADRARGLHRGGGDRRTLEGPRHGGALRQGPGGRPGGGQAVLRRGEVSRVRLRLVGLGGSGLPTVAAFLPPAPSTRRQSKKRVHLTLDSAPADTLALGGPGPVGRLGRDPVIKSIIRGDRTAPETPAAQAGGYTLGTPTQQEAAPGGPQEETHAQKTCHSASPGPPSRLPPTNCPSSRPGATARASWTSPSSTPMTRSG